MNGPLAPCLAAALALSSLACATTAKDFKLSSVRPDEAIIVGKVDVIYNGKPFAEKCLLIGDQALVMSDLSAMHDWAEVDLPPLPPP